MGNDNKNNHSTCEVARVQITPTRSILTLLAGPITLTVTYLTPIDVRDRFLHYVLDTYDLLAAL